VKNVSDYNDFENLEDDDISSLEDDRNEAKFQENNAITGVGAAIESIASDTRIYRLRLLYSQETFLGV